MYRRDSIRNFLPTLQDCVTPLYIASGKGYTNVVDILVKAGADTNKPCTMVFKWAIKMSIIHNTYIRM